MARVQVGDVDVAYEVAGEGDPFRAAGLLLDQL